MHYDLIIVGGGLVGKSLASALGKASINIALIDAQEQDRPDPRLIALNYGSFCFLKSLGLGSGLEQQSTPIDEVHVSHYGRFGRTRLTAKKIRLPALGYMIRAQSINDLLSETLRNTSDQNYYTELRPARVKGIELQEQHTTLNIEAKGKQIRMSGNLIIAADGTDSTLRKLLKLEVRTLDYQQSALVTTSTLHRSHQNVAYERFLEEGALAMLPLKDEEGLNNLCATIWTANTKTISALMTLKDHDFIQALQTQFGYRLGRLKNISQRHVFPLQFLQVNNPVQKQVVFVGNAAHTIHPIAAQGLNLALYELAHLSHSLLNNLREMRPLSQGLSELWLRFQPKTNLLFSHYLNQLFSSHSWGLNLARQLGMAGLDLCPPAKRQLSRLLAMENLQWLTQ